MEVLKSQVDNSVNFVTRTSDGGAFESRFVHRPGTDYFIAYLSTFSGCDKACRMCHLTATGQTMMQVATAWELEHQLEKVLSYAERHFPDIKKVHINFMARGEPLSSSSINSAWYTTFVDEAKWLTKKRDITDVQFIISTIMPDDFIDNDMRWFTADTAFYYSLYSVDPSFRKRWLPKAMHPIHAVSKLKRWQDRTNGIVKVHYPLIKDQNDSIADAHRVADLIHYSGLKASVNLIRYNPPNNKSEEAAEARYARVLNLFDELLPGSKVIPRVGSDVYASCGMFVNNG